MLNMFKTFTDNLLGRGDAAITVPVMDGVLKPNRALDQAELVCYLPGLDDISVDGHAIFLSAGQSVYQLKGSTPDKLFDTSAPITALASHDGTLALALAGRSVQTWRNNAGTWALQHQTPDNAGLHAVNALTFDALGQVWITDGSQRYSTEQWSHDLMALGHTGRVLRWAPSSSKTEVLAHDLHHAFGVLKLGEHVLFSESWKHRIRILGQVKPWLAELPSYPSRMAAASDGGVWLSCFVSRTQLVEFVLREKGYREKMVQEIDPRFWIVPALSSGNSFLEPLQGAGVKQMGVLKPWAPPRSYGLVIKVSAQGRIQSSMHSQVDGRHHGITGIAESQGHLYAVSKGSERLLRVALSPTSVQA
jgi:hypothetical protein